MCSTIKSSQYREILLVITLLLPILVSAYSDEDFLNALEANMTNILQSTNGCFRCSAE